MYILVADDEGPKLENIVEAVSPLFSGAEIGTARSVRAALDVLRTRDAHVLVLDMSLPTFDVAPGEQGGRPQNYGGIELLRYMDFYGIRCPVFIVTQYEAFPDKGGHVDLTSLAERLRGDHPSTFRDLIYYAGASDDGWRRRLIEAITGAELASS
jgi:CheY-like chemotaxis protein